MITIFKPYIEKRDSFSRLITKVRIGDDKLREIYVEVGNDFEQYLVVERNDAMLLAILPYALRNQQDITCEAPISEELLYNIKIRLLPTLKKGDSRVYIPQIYCECISEYQNNSGAIGTGISGG